MLHIASQGDGVYALLERDGRVVGSVRGASIRLGAFAGEAEAVRAALHGDDVIGAYVRGNLARSPAGEHTRVLDMLAARGAPAAPDAGSRTAPAGERPDGVRLVHDGAHEWIVLGRRPVARIVRPRAHGAEPRARFALEFVVPDVVPEAMRLTLARVLHRALGDPSERRAARIRATAVRAPDRSAVAEGARASDTPEPPPAA